jgi:hypothetical protein
MFEFQNKVDPNKEEEDKSALSDNSNISQHSNVDLFKKKYPNIVMNRSKAADFSDRESNGSKFYEDLGSINNEKIPKAKRNKSQFV